MEKTITLILSDGDVGQLLDGLRVRATSWEKTAVWMERHYDEEETNAAAGLFLIEECNDAKEAEQVAQHFRDIIAAIEAQRKQQNG